MNTPQHGPEHYALLLSRLLASEGLDIEQSAFVLLIAARAMLLVTADAKSSAELDLAMLELASRLHEPEADVFGVGTPAN